MRNILPLASLGCIAVIIFGMIAGGLIILGYGISGFLERPSHSETTAPEPKQAETLLQARRLFHTTRVRSNYRPNPDPPERVPGAGIIDYASGEHKFPAYLSKVRGGEAKHAAVVWVHDGFGGIDKGSWEQAKPFHDAGFVLMVPSFRGENMNAGRFEMFYGEADDLLAAVDYVANLPYVDRNRVYVAGCGHGGTLTLLAAVTGTTKVRAFFSISGVLDMSEFLRATHGEGFKEVSPPFDPRRVDEGRLRSALPFVGAIRQPTFYFGAHEETELRTQALEMEFVAQKQKVPFTRSHFLRANRFTIAGPVIQLLCTKIAADNKDAANSTIRFQPPELQGLFHP